MENKRILVIGGTGYIGRTLLKKMLEEKIKASILVKERTGPILNFEQIAGDVLDKNSLMLAMKNKNLIVYLAGIKKGPKKDCFEVNVKGIKNTIEAMKANNIKKIIYFSTKNVNLKKRDNYSESKRIAEEIVKKSGIDSIILKPDFVYGEDNENFFTKIIKIILKYRVFITFGKGDKDFYPVNKKFVVEMCVGFIKKFKKGIYGISGEKTSFEKLSYDLKSILGVNFLTIHIPLSLGEIIEPILQFSLSIFRESRPEIDNNIYSNDNLKTDLKKIVKINQKI